MSNRRFRCTCSFYDGQVRKARQPEQAGKDVSCSIMLPVNGDEWLCNGKLTCRHLHTPHETICSVGNSLSPYPVAHIAGHFHTDFIPSRTTMHTETACMHPSSLYVSVALPCVSCFIELSLAGPAAYIKLICEANRLMHAGS